MVGLIASLIVTVLMIGIVIPLAKRRPVGTPVTWGEAMVAGTYAFFLFFWTNGVVPHLWLTYADNELKWRNDKLLMGPGSILKPQPMGGWNPITLNYQFVRDIVAVLIYVVFLVATAAIWIWWQKRGQRAEKAAAHADESVFGRPLLKEG